MNPSRALIRLLALFAVSFGLIGLSPCGLGLLAVFVLLWGLTLQRHTLPVMAQRIWRMRWFFLAIGILYGLGGPAADQLHSWAMAAYRVGVLIVLVCTVSLCLNDLAADELAAGIISLLRPLRVLGVPVEAFARRLAMSLNSVKLMDDELRKLPKANHKQALDSVAQLCWSAENWQPQQNSSAAWLPASTADKMLGLSVLLLLLALQVWA